MEDMLAEMEHEMQVIKKNLKIAHDSHESYADQNMFFKEFQVRGKVYLHIKPKKSSLSIGSCAKLTRQFCGPFKVVERIGPVAN